MIKGILIIKKIRNQYINKKINRRSKKAKKEK